MDFLTVAETQSTNADLLAMAGEGAADGTWLRAERQTGGRGRLGRAWESPAGNLHCSTVLRLRPCDPPAPSLALVAAVAVQEALAGLAPGADLRIKWPNDIMAGEAKLSGMLLERAGDAIVIGIGVNVAQAPEVGGRAVARLADLGAATDAQAVMETIAGAFARWVDRWRTYGLVPVRQAWLAAAHPAGTPLRATLPDGAVIEGAFETLGEDGALILRLANGATHVIHAGDVFLL